MRDATQDFALPITPARLSNRQTALFLTGLDFNQSRLPAKRRLALYLYLYLCRLPAPATPATFR
ncbi:MAG: hypothetical protein EOO60_02395 [Hymenobacter sp.]|nr:MAG: hypothetical protein EOO60_02395 [Hymenobacter sp.]